MMDLTPDEVHGKLRQHFSANIRGGREIVRQAISEVLADSHGDVQWIKREFSRLVEDIQVRAYNIYLKSEQASAGSALRTVFSDLAGESSTAEVVFELLERYYHSLDRFFLGLTQGRRSRAGNAFEQVILDLFTRLRYPFTSRPRIDGTPDFLLPSEAYYRKNPLGCIIFTVKRTLRERWRQIVTEGTRARGFYLGTIDDKVPERDLREMMDGKIFLVVPFRLKAQIPHYLNAGNVLSFEQFFAHHLDPAMLQWKTEGIVS